MKGTIEWVYKGAVASSIGGDVLMTVDSVGIWLTFILVVIQSVIALSLWSMAKTYMEMKR